MFEYEEVLAINPNATQALHALGECMLFFGSIDEVIPLEEQSIRVSPRDPNVGMRYFRIGVVHLLHSRADDVARKSSQRHPRTTLHSHVVGFRLRLSGETERAAAELAEGPEARRR